MVAALVAAGWAVTAACTVAGLSRMSWYRHLTPVTPAGISVPHSERAYPNRVSDQEASAFLERLNSPEYAELSATQAFQRMLDAGEYFFSLATAHRVLRRAGLNGDRRPQRPYGSGSPRNKPVLHATSPNQVWCWDITDLRGPGRQAYKLYTVIDMFSRKIVGHRVEQQENASLAAEMIEQAVLGLWAAPDVLHADNGTAMRASNTYELLRRLGIRHSHSRPRTSNDNPFIEAMFKTVKYSLEFPDRFESLATARDYFNAYFTDYNRHHLHAGLNWYSPDSVHDGSWPTQQHQRQQSLNEHFRQHPTRYRKAPSVPGPPDKVWINQPTPQLSQTA
ncbi:IS3 family transposase [Arthrobacter sp. C152]